MADLQVLTDLRVKACGEFTPLYYYHHFRMMCAVSPLSRYLDSPRLARAHPYNGLLEVRDYFSLAYSETQWFASNGRIEYRAVPQSARVVDIYSITLFCFTHYFPLF